MKLHRSLARLLTLALITFLSSCGGGGGGGGTASNNTTSTTTCVLPNESLFYEVTTAPTCTTFTTNTLITTANTGSSADTFAFADGGGGDGGGSGGGGGDGGGGGGDLFIRVTAYLKNAVYVALGINNAYAQAITACGPGVEQSNLNKLTASGWKYLPLVKSTTPNGTACVKRIFDANKYLAVYATGLSKFDKTCYLVMVNKSNGNTHCFSSTLSLVLNDDFARTYVTYVDHMTPSLYDSPSLSNSTNKKYFGALLRDSDSGRLLYPRFTVDSDASIAFSNIFDSNNLNGQTPWNGQGVMKNITHQLLLNSGKVVTHFFRSVTDGNSYSGEDSGYTYLSDESNVSSPTLVNNNNYKNPQCLVQHPGLNQDNSFVGVLKLNANAPYDLVKLNTAGSSLQVITSNTIACLQFNNAIVTRRYIGDPNDGLLYYFAPTATNFSNYEIAVSQINLQNGNDSAVPSMTVTFPSVGTCGITTTNNYQNDDEINLNEASLILTDDQSKFILVARTKANFNSTADITSGGLSTIAVFDSNHNEILTSGIRPLEFSDCKVVRKFEKGSSGNFAYVKETLGQGLSNTLTQTTTTLDSSFSHVNIARNVVGPNLFKIGSMLKPL